MVSLKAALVSPDGVEAKKNNIDVDNSGNIIFFSDHDRKKRKWNHIWNDEEEQEPRSWMRKKEEKVPPPPPPDVDDVELHLDGSSPFPLGWQRCLDIKSGEIHFYNTRTCVRTSMDPRGCESETTMMTKPDLDLELNLSTWTAAAAVAIGCDRKDDGRVGRKEEMAAAVCVRCHMLIMMRRSSPTCPNCKFSYPAGAAEAATVAATVFLN